VSPKVLPRLLDELERDIVAGLPDVLARAEALREPILTQRDPLLKARYLLAADSIRNARRPMRALIDDLLLALRIFRSNGRDAEAVRCLVRLSDRYNLEGVYLAAQIAGRSALDRPELRLDDRLALLAPMTSALLYELRPQAAWALVDEVVSPRLEALQRLPGWADVLRLRAAMHFVAALRAARLPSLFTMDLAPGPSDEALVAHHLDHCERGLAEVARLRGPAAAPDRLRALCLALRGDTAAAVARLEGHPCEPGTLADALRQYDLGWCLRVGGQPQAALPWFEAARGIIAAMPAHNAELMIEFDIAQAHTLLGNWEAASAAKDRFILSRSRLFVAELDAIEALRRALSLAPESVAAPRLPRVEPAGDGAGPVAAPPPVDLPLRRAEPPYLAQAERALMAHLPRRLGPKEVAERTGVSLRSLQQAAREYRHETFGDVLRGRLMQEALRLMRDTNRSLRDIAAHCGYPDGSSFGRDFKRVHGTTPGMHRALLGTGVSPGGWEEGADSAEPGAAR
jgi:AraC-like DNA-binding protein